MSVLMAAKTILHVHHLQTAFRLGTGRHHHLQQHRHRYHNILLIMDPSRKTLSPPHLLKSISPIRRSGSPYRRRQIAQLEQGFREKRQRTQEPQSSPTKNTVTFSDVPKLSTSASEDAPQTEEVLANMAIALDKVASTFTTTASQLKDTRETQVQTLQELAHLRAIVEKLLADVQTLLERSEKSKP